MFVRINYCLCEYKELRCRVSSQLVMGMAVFMLGLLSVYLTLPLLISQKGNSDHGNCLIVAVLLHYFFLGSFSWMSTLGLSLLNTFGGIHICRLCFTYFKLKLTQCGTGPNSVSQMISDSSVNGMMVRTNVRNHSKDIHKRTALSSVFAITLPLCFVVPALILNEIYRYNQCWTGDENDRPSYFTSPGNDKEQQNCTEMSRQMRYYNPGFCFIESGIRPWFTVHGAFILWFFLPTALMLAFNSGVLLLVSTYIWLSNQNKTLKSLSEDTVTSGDSKSAKNYDKYNRNMIRICMHLSITLGIVWIFQLLASLIPHQSIVNRIAGLISSGQGAALGFVSLMNTKRGKSLLNWTSFFHSTRSNVRSSDVKSVSSPCQSGVKAANETDIPVADVRSVNY
ncbi:unnamed protein product [Heterobilharzia americana]|nr:unnamed protein product [Heterobilharzia americana]